MLETITSSTQISSLFTHGKRVSGPCVTVLVCKREEEHDQHGRVAFVAGKKLGGAVWRNAAKRRLREVCRSLGGSWPSYDVVFIAKSSIMQESYSTVCRQCEELVRRALKECDL